MVNVIMKGFNRLQTMLCNGKNLSSSEQFGAGTVQLLLATVLQCCCTLICKPLGELLSLKVTELAGASFIHTADFFQAHQNDGSAGNGLDPSNIAYLALLLLQQKIVPVKERDVVLLIKQRVQLGHTNIVHYRPSQLICQVKQQEEMFFS